MKEKAISKKMIIPFEGCTDSGWIDCEAWYNKYKKYWTKEECESYEREFLDDWKLRHGRTLQPPLF